MAFDVDEDVFRLYIPINNVFGVEVIKGEEDLDEVEFR